MALEDQVCFNVITLDTLLFPESDLNLEARQGQFLELLYRHAYMVCYLSEAHHDKNV